MIVVINPSNKAGHSFQGLHQYCAHDEGRARTSERVDWISMRNIATEDPDHAWKVMAATTYAQNELKKANDIRTGRAPKNGAVMHVVMSFDQDEPAEREAMEQAADELLTHLGVDPAKMRSKNKPSRRQFADEHQTVMYAHTDKDHRHIHLMINRVHPQHGIVLPTNNDHNKAQNWALKYSQQHGTDHKTPARKENDEMRRNGEYVKAEKRKTRNAYEQDKKIREVSNDNKRFKDLLDEQRKKSADLAERGRMLKAEQDKLLDNLKEQHKQRQAGLLDQLKTQINKTKSEIREDYRSQIRELLSQQKAERQTFEAMEKSFFGRAANAYKTIRANAEDIGGHRKGFNLRRFNVSVNAGERQRIFDAAQERVRKAVEAERRNKLQERVEALKDTQRANMEENRQRLLAERQALKEQHLKNVEQLKEQWKQHNFEKEQMLRNAPAPSQEKPDIAQEAELKRSSIAHRTDFDSARQPQASEQDNNQIKTGEDLANQKSLSSEYAETQRRHAEEAQKQSEQNRCQNKDDRNH